MLWWHWVALGALLLVVDVALVNTYFLLWFGFGGLIIGIAVWALPEMPLWAQLLAWGVVSGGFIALWLFLLKPLRSGRNLEQAREQMPGLSGTVVRIADGHGTLRLQRPVGGTDSWKFRSKEDLRQGDAVHVTGLGEDGVASVEGISRHSDEPVGAEPARIAE